MNRFERLLTMVPWLVRNPGISHQEVADHFQISVDQVLQDIMLLTVTGIGQYPNEQFDVDYSGQRIFVRDQLGLNRPFTFDSTEAACLLLGLESLANLPKELSGFEKAEINAVRERISQAIPIKSGVNVVQEELQEDGLVSQIVDAIKYEKQISFDYWNNARDDVLTRTVSPLRIYSKNQVSILDAFETEKGWRSFRLANVDSLKILDEKVDYGSQPFEAMKTIEVEIIVPNRIHYLLETFSVVKRRNLDTERMKVVVKIAEPLWLARKILASGCRIQVLAPENVKSTVEKHITDARAAYAKINDSK